MAFTPLHDRVLVERVESEEKTAGGLIIPHRNCLWRLVTSEPSPIDLKFQ